MPTATATVLPVLGPDPGPWPLDVLLGGVVVLGRVALIDGSWLAVPVIFGKMALKTP